MNAIDIPAPDLRIAFPRSPRALLGGYVVAARALDKCRAELAGINGDYSFWPCSLSQRLFEFTGISPGQFRALAATGASDAEVAAWLQGTSQVRDRQAVIAWNHRLRDLRLSELPPETQTYLEDEVLPTLPPDRPAYVWFDVFDLAEGRFASGG